MNQKEFKEFWKSKDYKNVTSKAFNEKQVIKNINLLLKEKDFKRLDYDKKLELVNNIIGDPKKQYKDFVNKETKEAIKVGSKRLESKRNGI
jgi:hypothetical protein